MKKTAPLLFLIMALLFSSVAGAQFFALVGANPMTGMTPAPYMPFITIGSDGSIDPANVSINKAGNVYTLTGNITNYSLDVKCDNITLDGAGFTIQEDPFPSKYAPSCGITVSSNGVTVKNMNIHHHDTAIIVYGSHNIVTKINLGPSVKIEGNYNEIIENVFPDSYLIVQGNFNTIKGNILRVRGIVIGGNFNKAIANTLEQCRDFAVKPSNGTNFFYLNNFINNTYILASLNDSSTQKLFAKLDLAKLAQTNISPFRWQMIPNGWKAIYPDNTVFDNGTFGNYWSDYTGTDANHDGIGDTPYTIGGKLQDRYPLMAPFDISSASLGLPEGSSPLPSPQETEPQQPEPLPTTLVAAASGASVTVVCVGLLLFYLKKRNAKSSA
jgi:hypothetical protein